MLRPENELIELVWKNRYVVMHSQAHQTTNSISQQKEVNKDGNNLNLEEGNVSWMQYPLDDSLTKDFCLDFLYGMPTSESIGMDELGKDMVGERCVMLRSNEENNTFINPLGGTMLCPPSSEIIGSTIPQSGSVKTSELVKFSCFTRPVKINAERCRHHPSEKDAISTTQRKVGEASSMVLKLPGNHIQREPDIGHVLSSGVLAALPEQEEGAKKKIWVRGHQTEIHDTTTTVSSSTGRSGSSVGRAYQQITNSQSHKRKEREGEGFESHSEEAEDQSVKKVASCKNLSILHKHEDQSVEVGRHPQRSTSTRRNRAAEVHNLSERRRRDRINEKMKALQELIPHCYKTDKASMLDEAIEYLKSLQLQVQIMWMGGGMPPMMFANPQHSMSLMGRGGGQGSVPSVHVSSQMPSIPMPNPSVPPVGTANQAATIPSQILNSVNFSNQMQNSTTPDANASHLGFHNIPIPSEAMDLFSSIQPLSARPNQTLLIGSNGPNEISLSESILNDMSG